MPRAPGWLILSEIALELAALAVVERATLPRVKPAGPPRFLADVADSGARYLRAGDGAVAFAVGLYSDGRVRIVDAVGRRFSGEIYDARARMFEVGGDDYFELFLEPAPRDSMRLRLRGGSYDDRLLDCEAWPR